jgi:hypothetical protein
MALFRRKEPRAEPAGTAGGAADTTGTFLPERTRRRTVESALVRLIATGGIVGVGTVIAAIMGSQDVASWIVGLVVAGVSVILAAILWSSRTL